MAIYVDQSNKPFGRTMMCHMISDEEVGHEELSRFARKIGVATKWIQHEGTWRVHFDICKSVRKQALVNGAIEVSDRELSMIMRSKPGVPESKRYRCK